MNEKDWILLMIVGKLLMFAFWVFIMTKVSDSRIRKAIKEYAQGVYKYD